MSEVVGRVVVSRTNDQLVRRDDSLAPARGIVNGVLLCVPFWVLALALVWWLL